MARKLPKVLAPLSLAWIVSCVPLGGPAVPGRPVREAYDGGHELRLLDVDSPLRAERRVPVLSTPEVFAAYVPSHAEPDLLIGEHWIFFKLTDAEWFVERLQAPDPPVDGDAPAEHLRALLDLDWKGVVIPHQRKP